VRVHAIQTGTVQVRTRQLRGSGPGLVRGLRTTLDRHWTEPLPIYAWLVEHEDGPILVDTGETARATEPGYFPRWHPYFRRAVRAHVAPGEELGPQLERLGVGAVDVRTVVLTHMHTDHAGGLDHVRGREVLVARGELRRASGLRGQLNGYLPHRWPEGAALVPIDLDAGAYGPFPQSRRIARGVHAIGTAGHTPDHVSVVVEGDHGLTVLAGDVSYTERLMLDGATDGVCPNPREAEETIRRMQELVAGSGATYLPSHDPESAARLAAAAGRQGKP
jgi:glyoxylase-like metal-dependent hydrolase (beta-lactamase superfamily II)